ncbi:MAG TPA: hypothetical protein VGC00_02765 [Thermoanaerobaculia bacterium]|jgi:hypothetical protein
MTESSTPTRSSPIEISPQTLARLGGAAYLQAFTPEQLAALARMSGRAHAHGFGSSLLFTGCFFLVAGYLIRKSG